MIVKNEELTLGKCLASVKPVADEIVIVDTGSVDRTKKVAAEFTDKIFDFKWVDDFSAARNFAFGKATGDYILWLDADDILLPDDVVKFQKLKKDLSPDVSTVMMKYNTGFDKDGNVNFSFFRERLVKRNAGFKWKEPVHEYIETYGKTITADVCVTHTKKSKVSDGRNLQIYENLLKNGIELSPRGTYYYARELKDAGRNSDAVQYFEKFLKSGKGWIEDNIASCCALSECLLHSEPHKSLHFLLKSFEYDTPRPETCCRLGYWFKQKKKYQQAVFWFELAIGAAKNLVTVGFRQEDYTGYIPCLELAVCCYLLGDNQKAFEYNEMAAVFRPDCPSVLNNKKLFTDLIKTN